MFDNFGLGEFFFLALLALLFFGPERLPEIGARIGRWINQMTQYSKAFMTEWREEAMVIHDAVEEVKGIRDEIMSAQREIAGTLDSARGDMEDGLEVAREAVTGAARDVTTRIQQQRLRAAQDFERLGEEGSVAASPAAGTDAAVGRTQQVLADLERRRASSRTDAPLEEAAGDTASVEATAADAEPFDSRTPTEMQAAASETAAASPEDEEWEQIHHLIEEGMSPKRPARETQAEAQDSAPAEPTVAPAAASSPRSPSPSTPATASAASATQGSPAGEDGTAPEEAPEPPKESAFDRTQKVLETLRKRRAGMAEESPPEPVAEAEAEPAAAAAPGSTPSTPTETAFDRTQQVLQNLKRKRKGKDQGAPAQAPLSPVNRDDFERLNSEVLQLRDQMKALHDELRALRALAGQANAAADDVTIEEAV